MPDLLLNDFEKKVIIKKLKPYNIVNIINDHYISQNGVYTVSFLYRGFLMSCWIMFDKRFFSDKSSSKKDVNSFCDSLAYRMNSNIVYFDEIYGDDEPLDQKQILSEYLLEDEKYLNFLINTLYKSFQLLDDYGLINFKVDSYLLDELHTKTTEFLDKNFNTLDTYKACFEYFCNESFEEVIERLSKLDIEYMARNEGGIKA